MLIKLIRGMTMTNQTTKDQQARELALYEELAVRYGAGLAQEIVDQIKKAEDQDNKPEYMAVKALSEVLETFRADAKAKSKSLKTARSKKLPKGIASLEQKRLKNDLNNIFTCYWLVQHGFYKSYNKALKICEVPETYRYDKYTKPTEMKMTA